MSKNDGGPAFPCPIAQNDMGNLVTSDEIVGVSTKTVALARLTKTTVDMNTDI